MSEDLSKFRAWLKIQESLRYPFYIEQSLDKLVSIRRAFKKEDDYSQLVSCFNDWIKQRPISAVQALGHLIDLALAGIPMPWEEEHEEKRIAANVRRINFAMMPAIEIKEEIEPGNPLEFWVAYQEGSDGKLHYLGDGKGNLRLFKTQGGLQSFLDKNLTPEQAAVTVMHSIQGKIAIPKADDESGALMPISTLLLPTVPSAQELLEERMRRKKGVGHE